MMNSIITREMREAIGVESKPNTFKIHTKDIIRFADSIGDGNPIFNDEYKPDGTQRGNFIAPPTFLRSCSPGPPMLRPDFPFSASMDGGSDWEYFESVRPGDTVTVTSKFIDFEEKQGRLGAMLIALRELKYVNQFDSLIALERNTVIMYNPPGNPNHSSRVWAIHDEDQALYTNQQQQIYYEDVEQGMKLPTLKKIPTTRQLVKYAAASIEYPEVHYDLRQAKSAGLPDVLVQGSLKHAFLGQLLTGWMGEGGILKKLNVEYRGMDTPGNPIYCKGIVVRKHTKERDYLVDFEIWIENSKMDKTTSGFATVSLPSRSDII